MYDFWLGVFASLAVLVVTLAYRSRIGGDVRGTSVLHDILARGRCGAPTRGHTRMRLSCALRS